MPLDLTPNQPPYYEIVDGPAPSGTKYYLANLTQSGTNAPVATVLQNTLGLTPVWSRFSLGTYNLTAASAIFPEAKTAVLLSGLNGGFLYYTWGDEQTLTIESKDDTATHSDGYIGGYTTIYIIVTP